MMVRSKIAHCPIGKFADAIAMGIIRRNGQVIFPDMLDKDRRQLFACLAASPALALEVGARLLFRDFCLAMPFVLPMLIHPLEPKRHPAATRFEMSNLQLGKFLQYAVGAEV